MEARYITALDIGTTKIACLIAKVHKDKKIELVGVGTTPSVGVWCGQVRNIDQTVDSINRAVADAQQQAGVSISRVNVGIAGKHIRCAHNRGFLNKEDASVPITSDDVELLKKDQYKVMLNPGEEIIDVIPQNYIVDKSFDVKQPVGMVGKMVEANFHLVIGMTDSVNHIKKSVEMAGLITNKIILEPIASAEAVLSEEEKEAGVILVDIGGGTTDVAIYHDKVIKHSAVIPFGGNNITADIKNECGILEKQAEDLKKQFGEALYTMVDKTKVVAVPGIKGREPKEISLEFLARVIQYRVEEIIEGVMFEVQLADVAGKIGAGIVLTGGGSQLKNLEQLFAFKSKMDVRIGSPEEHIDSVNHKQINHPMYATAVGLLVKGLESQRVAKKKEPVTQAAPATPPQATPKVEPFTPPLMDSDEWKAPIMDKKKTKTDKAEKSPKSDKGKGIFDMVRNLFEVDEDSKHN